MSQTTCTNPTVNKSPYSYLKDLTTQNISTSATIETSGCSVTGSATIQLNDNKVIINIPTITIQSSSSCTINLKYNNKYIFSAKLSNVTQGQMYVLQVTYNLQ